MPHHLLDLLGTLDLGLQITVYNAVLYKDHISQLQPCIIRLSLSRTGSYIFYSAFPNHSLLRSSE
jgi:hypothetical protein